MDLKIIPQLKSSMTFNFTMILFIGVYEVQELSG